MELAKSGKVTTAVTPTNGAAGATNINGVTLDVQGFERVLMVVSVGAVVSGAATSIKVQQGDQSDASDMSDLAGTAQTIADTDDDKTFYIEIVKPTKRYVRPVVLRATQNATVCANYVQYGARKAPTSHGTGVTGEAHGERQVSVADGRWRPSERRPPIPRGMGRVGQQLPDAGYLFRVASRTAVPVSTTHVITSSILGMGSTRRQS